MKTNFFKIGLTFMMATAFAFASANSNSEKESLVTGYIFQDGQCRPSPKDCNNLAGPLCKESVSGLQVYANNIAGTVCQGEMTHWQ